MAARAGLHEIPVTPQKRGSSDANVKRLEKGTFRFPESQGDGVEVTPAQMAAVLEGIDLSRARRLPRFVLPAPQPA
jgi:hypothetical protein